jgi:putative membrane protein (TIGR04086 family)
MILLRYDKINGKDSNLSVALKSVLFGTAVGATICTGFLFLFAFMLVTVKSVPQFLIQYIAIFCAAIGAFVSGYMAIRIYRSKGLIYGALAGFMLFIIITLLAFIISRDKFTYLTLVRLLAMVFSGALGGFLAVNKKRRK